jgi:radical SAM protein with 4Fe4S-binding SPASM domain
MSKSKHDLQEKVRLSGLLPPKMLTLGITKGCNLQCRHCLLDCPIFSATSPVPAKTLKPLIRDFAQIGGESICLAGGEPLTHPEWFEILEFPCGIPGFKEIRLQTNGTLLTQVEVEALISLRAKKIVIQVSLDGARAETHDKVRGPGNFERAIRGVRLLSEAGLAKQTHIAFTEMRHNFEDLPRLLEIVEELDLRGLVSGTLVRGGRAAKSDRMALPTPSQIRGLLEQYHADSRFRARYEKFGNIAALEWYEGRLTPSAQVCTCIENPMISADRLMYPCKMLLADEFAVPIPPTGLHDHPLVDMMTQALPLWSKLPIISQRRSVELKKCQKCPGGRHCAGGCMGRAYAASGDLMSEEDRCSLRRAVYTWNTAD